MNLIILISFLVVVCVNCELAKQSSDVNYVVAKPETNILPSMLPVNLVKYGQYAGYPIQKLTFGPNMAYNKPVLNYINHKHYYPPLPLSINHLPIGYEMKKIHSSNYLPHSDGLIVAQNKFQHPILYNSNYHIEHLKRDSALVETINHPSDLRMISDHHNYLNPIIDHFNPIKSLNHLNEHLINKNYVLNPHLNGHLIDGKHHDLIAPHSNGHLINKHHDLIAPHSNGHLINKHHDLIAPHLNGHLINKHHDLIAPHLNGHLIDSKHHDLIAPHLNGHLINKHHDLIAPHLNGHLIDSKHHDLIAPHLNGHLINKHQDLIAPHLNGHLINKHHDHHIKGHDVHQPIIPEPFVASYPSVASSFVKYANPLSHTSYFMKINHVIPETKHHHAYRTELPFFEANNHKLPVQYVNHFGLDPNYHIQTASNIKK